MLTHPNRTVVSAQDTQEKYLLGFLGFDALGKWTLLVW